MSDAVDPITYACNVNILLALHLISKIQFSSPLEYKLHIKYGAKAGGTL